MDKATSESIALLVDKAGHHAERALELGVLRAAPHTVIAYVPVSDCTSRLIPTMRARLYEKIRCAASAVRAATEAAARDMDMPSPRVEIRLRQSSGLLAGHGPDAWSILTAAIHEAISHAGVPSATSPLVAWNIVQVCERFPDVLPTVPGMVLRMDLGTYPDPLDIRGLSLGLLMTSSGWAVVSAGAGACAPSDPDQIELSARGSISPHAREGAPVFDAWAALVSRKCVEFTRRLAAGQPEWKAGPPHIDLEPGQFRFSRPTTGSAVPVWTSGGWPVSRPESNVISLGTASPDDITDVLGRTLSSASSAGPRYAVMELT